MEYTSRKTLRQEKRKKTLTHKKKTQTAVSLAALSCVGATTIIQPITANASDATQNYTTRSLSESDFLALAAPHAQEVAAQNDLYASVMIAQAILESGWGGSSLSMAPNYNLFGIKGTYNGQSVTMPTKEYVNGQWITINAAFRKYPSYKQSFEDNARVLKTVSFSPGNYYYSGAWKSNTSSYKDATAWLTGRYATAPNYNTALNRIIELYNLTKYDTPGSNSNNTNINTSTDTSSSIKKGTITASPNLIIRSQPSSNSSNLGSYAYNQTVDITAQTTGTTVNGTNIWYKTNKGYISAAYVKAFQNNTDQNTTTQASKQGTVTAAPSLSIRTSASTSSGVIGSYSNNAKINIIGETTGTSVNGNNKWYKTDKGFVSAAYVTTSGSSNTTNNASQNNQVNNTNKTGTTNYAMNIRKSASTSSPTVGSYVKGTKLDIIGETTGSSVNGNTKWYKTNKGFVSAAYVTTTNNSQNNSSNKETSPNNKSYTVKSGDSVWAISTKFKISMNDFIQWNNIKNNFLYPGQKVIIQK